MCGIRMERKGRRNIDKMEKVEVSQQDRMEWKVKGRQQKGVQCKWDLDGRGNRVVDNKKIDQQYIHAYTDTFLAKSIYVCTMYIQHYTYPP